MSDRGASILLVDDHALFRDSVARFLDSESGFRVVGGCATNTVDLVLLDFDLGQRDGLDFMRLAESIGYRGRVLLVTAGVDEASAAHLLKRGIAGIFLKHDPPARLVEAIREVLAGKVWFDQNYLKRSSAARQSKSCPALARLQSANSRCSSESLKGQQTSRSPTAYRYPRVL